MSEVLIPTYLDTQNKNLNAFTPSTNDLELSFTQSIEVKHKYIPSHEISIQNGEKVIVLTDEANFCPAAYSFICKLRNYVLRKLSFPNEIIEISDDTPVRRMNIVTLENLYNLSFDNLNEGIVICKSGGVREYGERSGFWIRKEDEVLRINLVSWPIKFIHKFENKIRMKFSLDKVAEGKKGLVILGRSVEIPIDEIHIWEYFLEMLENFSDIDGSYQFNRPNHSPV